MTARSALLRHSASVFPRSPVRAPVDRDQGALGVSTQVSDFSQQTGRKPVAAQKSIWSSVKIATEEFYQPNGTLAAAVLCYQYVDAGRYGTRASAVVVRSYRPRRNGHACMVAKEFTRRGVRSDDADHQPPGKR